MLWFFVVLRLNKGEEQQKRSKIQSNIYSVQMLWAAMDAALDATWQTLR